ncbi:C4-dicarboxylate TRAP transporter substrate-binding protein [uncultured Tateyamaria sp.]|uniref:C4-dicarboxylate TRAP transporter substrate-binding protein n=1 Tax=uncultured Tateyamaria sp. TaxID=455651 RepID=UPI0026146307|nr:C4-dicarboxylate TRAP transporter substrate-binding protein [uncultured Tateyamaria sp.]
MTHNRRTVLAGLAAATGTALLPAAARADTIRLTMASSHPTAVPWVGSLSSHVVGQSNTRLTDAGSPHSIDWTESYGGALYKFDKTLEAVADGLTDMGWVGTLWEESKMPLQNVTFYTPFVTDDLPMQLAVMNQLHRDMPGLSEAWARQSQVFLGASGIETYHLLTREPFDNYAQLDGMKIIAAGSVGNFLKGSGAVPVNAGLPDFYNTLSTGVADGVLISLSGGFPFKLYEPAPFVTKVSIGSQMTGGLAVNQRKWRRLPQDVTEVLQTLGDEYSAVHAKQLMAASEGYEAKMIEAGATITTLAAPERQKWVDNLPDIAGSWVEATEARGASARNILTAYMDAVTAAGATPARNWG